MIQRIAIMGCGLIGSSWATFFASKGLPTRMYDVDSATCQRSAQRARENLRTLVDLTYLPSADLHAALANLQPVNSLDELLHECDYVQESVLEDYENESSGLIARWNNTCRRRQSSPAVPPGC